MPMWVKHYSHVAAMASATHIRARPSLAFPTCSTLGSIRHGRCTG